MPAKASELIKKINNLTILNTVREKEPVSRADIAKITGLNPATVSSNVNELLKSGFVIETGSGESSGGRRPVMVQLNSRAFHVIGVDMGISKVKTAVMDFGGKISQKCVIHYPEETNERVIMCIIKQSIHNVMEKSGTDIGSIMGVGVGVHGIVNSDEGISVYAPAFRWRNVDIKSILKDEFDLPVFIDNDVRAMALGEMWFGAAKGVDDFVFINIGSGIGSGIMIGGEPYKGTSFGAGEIGHISIDDSGPKCNCGNYGCLEVMASGPAIARRMISQIKMGKNTLVTRLVNDDLSKVNGEAVYEAAKMGDAVATDILQETGRYIGIAISSVINILNPRLILIGGGVSMAGDFIFKPLIEVAKKKSLKDSGENVSILPAGLKEDCGVIGAAALVIKNFFQIPRIQ